MKSPQEIANSFLGVIPADRVERVKKFIPRLVDAANGEPIYGGEFNETKRPLDYSFEQAFDAIRNAHRPADGGFDGAGNRTVWASISDTLGYSGNLRNSIAMAKKAAKLKMSDPYLTAVKQFLAACVPMAEMMESIKKKVIKGRRPPAQTSAQKRIAGRAGGSGTCQICGGDQAIVRNNIALHGYERPGHGYIKGRCFGADKLPFEVSCDALRAWIGMLRGYLTRTHDELAKLPFVTSLTVEETVYENGHIVYENRQIKRRLVSVGPEDPRFEKRRANKKAELEHQIRQLNSDIAAQTKRLDNWRPAQVTP